MEELLAAGGNVMRMNFLTAILPNIKLRLIMPERGFQGKIGIPVAFVAGFGRTENRESAIFTKRKRRFERRPDFSLTTEKIVGDEKESMLITLRCPRK